MAPLGVPVVPPVYCSTATWPGSPTTGVAGAASRTRDAKGTCSASCGMAASSRRLNSRNSAAFAGGRMPAMGQTTSRRSPAATATLATRRYVASRSITTMIVAPESRIWYDSSRSTYSGLKFTTVPPARSTAK